MEEETQLTGDLQIILTNISLRFKEPHVFVSVFVFLVFFWFH